MNLSKYNCKEIGTNEAIIRVVRRHWFDILSQYLIFFGLGVALIAGFFVFSLLPSEFQDSIGSPLVFFVGSFLALAGWLYASLIWIDYYLDVWIITSKRIVNIEQRGLFVRHVSELKLQNIQDVTTEVEGLIPTFLNYGEVHIQTAGEQVRFIFRNVPDPDKIKKEIMQAQEEEKKYLGAANKN